MSERARRLLLVRHGLPDYATRKPGDLPPGPPLSLIGRQQVTQTIPVLAAHPIESLHTSPLARAWQSAEIVGRALDLPVSVDSDMREWHRTERLAQVSERAARWLHHWLRGPEACAAVFGHGSPLLSILRTALYLPQHTWWQGRDTDRLVLSTGDRFEFSMAAVFELEIGPSEVIARRLFHPTPRIAYVHRPTGRVVGAFPRPTLCGEGVEVRRPNLLRLVAG